MRIRHQYSLNLPGIGRVFTECRGARRPLSQGTLHPEWGWCHSAASWVLPSVHSSPHSWLQIPTGASGAQQLSQKTKEAGLCSPPCIITQVSTHMHTHIHHNFLCSGCPGDVISCCAAGMGVWAGSAWVCALLGHHSVGLTVMHMEHGAGWEHSSLSSGPVPTVRHRD